MMIDRLFSRVLLLVIPLYFTQGVLFGSGSIVSQMLIGIWLLIDFYYLIVYLYKGKRNRLLNVFVLFWIVNLLYWIYSPKVVASQGVSFATFGDFKNTTIVVLSFFPFSYFQENETINVKYLMLFSSLFLFAAISAFLTQRDALVSEYGVDRTNNTAYYFAVLLPFIGVYWRKKLFWIWYFVIIVFLLLCAKRGAIVCGVIALVVFLFLSNRDVQNSNRVWRVFGMMLILIALLIVVYYLFSSSELLQQRFQATQEGDSSQRDWIYSTLWSIFMESNIINTLFGHGMSQTVTLIGGYAHNDWLELLTNEGIVGVLLYASIYISLISYYRRNKHSIHMRGKYIFITAILCMFFRSTFSMGYLAPESAMFCVAMACGLKMKQ